MTQDNSKYTIILESRLKSQYYTMLSILYAVHANEYIKILIVTATEIMDVFFFLWAFPSFPAFL